LAAHLRHVVRALKRKRRAAGDRQAGQVIHAGWLGGGSAYDHVA
jgi:hypothetical protein